MIFEQAYLRHALNQGRENETKHHYDVVDMKIAIAIAIACMYIDMQATVHSR